MSGDIPDVSTVVSLARRLRAVSNEGRVDGRAQAELLSAIMAPSPKKVLSAMERADLETELANLRFDIDRLKHGSKYVGQLHNRIKEIRDQLS